MKQSTLTKVAAVVAVVLTLLTMVAVFFNVRAGAAAEAAITQRQVSLDASRAVSASSGLLTNTVRAFAATGDKQWLEQYWTEIDTTKSQAKAIETLKHQNTPESELALIAKATQNSAGLVQAETRAMRLVLQADRVPEAQMPAAVAAFKLSAQDAALSPEAKKQQAIQLVFGTEYQDSVKNIMAPITEFQTTLANRVNTAYAQAEGQRKAVEFALTACATLLAAALFAVLALFHRNLGSIIRRYSEQLRTVDERDLSFRLQPAGVLELQELVEAFNAKNENVAGVLSGVTRSADSLAQASSRLTETAGQLEKSSQRTNSESRAAADAADTVSGSVSTVAAGTEEMSSSIREIATAANRATGVAQEAVRSAQATSGTVAKLGESSALIGEVVKTITSIAEQTNLLALNATIEVARRRGRQGLRRRRQRGQGARPAERPRHRGHLPARREHPGRRDGHGERARRDHRRHRADQRDPGDDRLRRRGADRDDERDEPLGPRRRRGLPRDRREHRSCRERRGRELRRGRADAHLGAGAVLPGQRPQGARLGLPPLSQARGTASGVVANSINRRTTSSSNGWGRAPTSACR